MPDQSPTGTPLFSQSTIRILMLLSLVLTAALAGVHDQWGAQVPAAKYLAFASGLVGVLLSGVSQGWRKDVS